MNVSRFLPPPVGLNQTPGGNVPQSGPGPEITHRSFLKRAGGATVATLVAWNAAGRQTASAGDGTGSGGGSAPPIKPKLRTYTRSLFISGYNANGNYEFTGDRQMAKLFSDDNPPEQSKIPDPICNPPGDPKWLGANMVPLPGGQLDVQTHKNASADSPGVTVSKNGSVSGNNIDGYVKSVQVIVTYLWTYP